MTPRTLRSWAQVGPALLLTSMACQVDAPLPTDDPEQRALRALLDDAPLSGMAIPHTQALTVDAGAPPPLRPDAGGFAGAGGSFPVDGGGFGGSGGSFVSDGGFGGKGGFDGSPPDGGFGGAGGGFPFPTGPLGIWTMDDCNPFRTELFDSSFSRNSAFRSVGVACVPGSSGQAVRIRTRTDYVYVPDQPNFTFERGMTVAAWVDPATLGGARTIVRKREGDSSAFALLANDRDLQLVLALTTGRAASLKVRLPSRSDGFVHVAATYDGETMRLYLGGEIAASGRVRGTIGSERGPILIGNDATGRLFDGVVDEVLFDTQALSAERIAELACVRRAPIVKVTPAIGGPVGPDVPVTFQVHVTSQDDPICRPSGFQIFTNRFDPGLTIDPSFSALFDVAPGQTRAQSINVTASDDLDPGRITIPFSVASFERFDARADGELVFDLAATGCRISTRRELMITTTAVVDDPVRTTFAADPADPRSGAWTFARLMRNLAPTPEQAPQLVQRLFETWLSDQTVNGTIVGARPAMGPMVLDAWPRLPDGQLDLERAPLRLSAIVNRTDLRQPSAGNAGEGRFVFNVFDASGFPLEFNVILEYKLLAGTPQEQRGWIDAWHALGALEPGSEAYNSALQAITDRFTQRNALAALRTNEIALSFIWELRQFRLGADGFFQMEPLDLTPRRELNGSDVLGRFVDANRSAIRAATHVVPATFEGEPFQAGSVTNDLGGWFFPDPSFDAQARRELSINTCNGCHSSTETNTFFTQVSPRFPGFEASLSPFLTGTTVFDPNDGSSRTLNDLARRRADLRTLVCPPAPTATARTARTSIPAGIRRVH